MKVSPHFMPSTKFMSALRAGMYDLSGRQSTPSFIALRYISATVSGFRIGAPPPSNARTNFR